MHQESLIQRGDFPIRLVLLTTALTMEPNHVGYTLPCPCTAFFQTFLVSAFRSVFTHVVSIYANLLEQKKAFAQEKSTPPEDWFGTKTWPPFHCFGTRIWLP